MAEELIDPRDATEEERHPGYRVEFRERSRPAVETWRVTGRDVEGVLEWAEAEARGRRTVVWVECVIEQGLILLRLNGDAGPADDGGPSFGYGAPAMASG